MNERFGQFEEEKSLVLATFLDARYKNRFFRNYETRIFAKESLTEILANEMPSSTESDERLSSVDTTKNEDPWSSFQAAMPSEGKLSCVSGL